MTDGQGLENIERSGKNTEVDVGKPPDGLSEVVGTEEGVHGEDGWHGQDLGRDESSRHRMNRWLGKSRGRGSATEGTAENEQSLTSPGSGSRLILGRSNEDKSSSRHPNVKRILDSRKMSSQKNSHALDMSEIVKEAVQAAKAEARAVNALVEAIKAVQAAAAEVVKSAAVELPFFVQC